MNLENALLSKSAQWAGRFAIALSAVVMALVVALSWFFPVDVVQNWAVERAGEGSYAQFEASGHAEFLCWVTRLVSPVALVFVLIVWRNYSQFAKFACQCVNGFFGATLLLDDAGKIRPVATFLARSICIAWGLLFVGHFAESLRVRMKDWPYYRFRSGPQVLPNISESNVEVIHYLKRSTPEDARILVISDQKLFFLSYYLLPRRIYHKMHPDSEHVIPKEHLMRKLAAYRLTDLDEATLNRIRPDFVLEYFEHPDEVRAENVLDDAQWISFVRALRRDPQHIPRYLVRLSRFPRGGAQ